MIKKNHVEIYYQIQEKKNHFPIKDEKGLSDYQKLPDKTGIRIPEVGITRFRIPILFPHRDFDREYFMSHDVIASMKVNLREGKTGINMSRLVSILQKETMDTPFSHDLLKRVLKKFQNEMRDDIYELPFEYASLVLDFSYPMKQKSLKSNQWGWQYYQTQIESKVIYDKWELFYTIHYEYSSTCPCSLTLAHQYEYEYAQGLTNEGIGIATAHAQRSLAKVTVKIYPEEEFFIPELVRILREAIPTETQSMVKRIDEQAFAILNGENPMFVEHVARRLHTILDTDVRILDWKAEVEHFESLHSHNAYARIYKGIEGGFK
ncbi:MAG: GTP cyclohydrolase FolE2 [Leptospiraceae bacterium]|nr:GTP cyclohydrolase FolE2 [Leptospiraceae bacterium]MDW7976824.1 GTP cyclohydrolase FolE2 [Leptospiraceae bacterium]